MSKRERIEPSIVIGPEESSDDLSRRTNRVIDDAVWTERTAKSDSSNAPSSAPFGEQEPESLSPARPDHRGSQEPVGEIDNDGRRPVKPAPSFAVADASSTKKIGQILVSSNRMKESAIDEVLARQSKSPDKRFGQVAVSMGAATQRDVDRALAEQFGFSAESGSSALEAGLPDLPAAINPFSPFSEALRGLRSQLMLRWFDGSPGQVALAVTSVDRGDGKSFIVSNLGIVFSQLGEKTLIIDADLRNSTQHTKFGLPNKMGLSGILSGRAGVEEILSVPGLPNLAVLPSGPVPPNPQELLGREDFGRMLNSMAKAFNVILIDTPSAQQASDTNVIAQRARAALIVGRKDKTKSSEISQLASILQESHVKVLGSTLNEY